MNLIQPFAALRPASGRANDVVAPPYDVLSTAEARERASGRPWSFLHISKPEIDLPADTNPYAPEVYAKGAENLQAMIQAGVLVRDPAACYYVYRIVMGQHSQTGLVAAASVADYDTNRIRKHEFTRPDKEDDRVRQIDALDAQTGPVLLAYPAAPEVDAILAARIQRRARFRRRTRRRAPYAVGDPRRGDPGPHHRRLQRHARALHRRRPSSLGVGFAHRRRPQGSQSGAYRQRSPTTSSCR